MLIYGNKRENITISFDTRLWVNRFGVSLYNHTVWFTPSTENYSPSSFLMVLCKMNLIILTFTVIHGLILLNISKASSVFCCCWIECDDGELSSPGCSDCMINQGYSCFHDVLNRSLCTPLCGNGLLDSGEQCDDFNGGNGDGCNDEC